MIDQIKIDQIAYRKELKDSSAIAGEGWIFDKVESKVIVINGVDYSKSSCPHNVANLCFNYNILPGFELEYISYISGPNWIQSPLGSIFDRHPENTVTHMGMHVEDLQPWLNWSKEECITILQRVETISHTNPHVIKNNRRYEYLILDTRELLGFDLKLIKRIEG